MDNSAISEQLSLLGTYYGLDGDTYRSKAYIKASTAIAEHGTVITSGKQAMAIPGIGSSSASVIDEYLSTGKVQRLIELESKNADRKQTIDYLRSFYGIVQSAYLCTNSPLDMASGWTAL